MAQLRGLVLGLSGIMLALSAVNVVEAHGADAKPVIVISNRATDPQKLTWLPDDARKALGDEIASLKAGTVADFVFIAAGKNWDFRAVTKAGDFASIEELARIGLQSCEYWHHATCVIVSINGYDAVDATGTYPVQPPLLDDRPGSFDALRIPFIGADYQALASAYEKATGPRAFVVSASETFDWETGKTVFDAIAAAYAGCQKADAANQCLLYAVNSRVVFVPGDY